MMKKLNYKKIKLISIIFTFILCFISHFIYEIFPNFITSILFPVNESIWEHMKILYTSILIFGIIEYILIKNNNLNINNYIFIKFIESFLSIPIFLLLYLPFYYKIGENLLLNLSILFMTILIVEYIGYKLSKLNIINLNKISIILIIISYIIFGYLTYNPIKQDIFYDIKDNKYGINHYIN